MIRAVIFDMGQTLLRSRRPGDGSWRDMEIPGIRGIYRYIVEQGHPIASHEDEFVEVMFARLAEGWRQATGGQINLVTILIGSQIQGDALHNPGLGYALALGMIVIMVLVMIPYQWLRRLSERWLR